MKTFNLPDLAEGLEEAEILEWFVKVGDQVTTDQPLGSVETAKAAVEIPSPYDGTVEKLFGDVGDTINVGEPLVGFSVNETENDKPAQDAGTVVGQIPDGENNTVLASDTIKPNSTESIKASPAVRALAKKLNVDWQEVTPKGDRLTKEDIRAAQQQTPESDDHFTPLSARGKAMAVHMQTSHAEVVPITITDDINITSWFKQDDMTLRVIQAICDALQVEPVLNSHYDGKNFSYRTFEAVNLGVAVDTPHGLYVPVMQNAQSVNSESRRDCLNTFKEKAQTKKLTPEDMADPTIILSNFGNFSAKYATPIISPPTVCIIGVGRAYAAPVVVENNIQAGFLLPLSITADHRLITGGELTRFLKALKEYLH
jgi:2-oxoisovalerate dehydrogenase E2 component (dihydrolipoyl transacylase)